MLVVLLQVLEQGLLGLFEQALEQRLQRCKLRKQHMAPEQNLEHVQVRLDERRLEQGLHVRLESGFLQMLLEVNRRRLLRVLEQGQGKGEGFPEWPSVQQPRSE